ncbi:MAG: peptidase S41 [Candidatus Eisenbacteria bacterium]|nr:peptidase S41 [Candidatus Eisenbacteria bacterium]
MTAEVVRRGGRVPFHFVWIARRMVVTRDLTAGAQLPRGTEVMSVQGVRAADLLLSMMRFVGADGSNDAKRVSALEVQGRSAYESFDLFLPLLLDGVEERLELRVRFPGEQAVRAVSVAPLGWEDRKRDHDAREEASGGLPWSLDFSDSAFALLRMDSWAVYNSGVNWDSTLNSMLDRVVDSGRLALVVDLRNNAGGLDCGDVILQRLVRDTTRFELERRFVRYRRTPADLDSSLDTWDDSFRDFTADTPESPGPDGLYPVGGGAGDAFGVIVPKGRPFHGRVYVLVGPANSSATFQFASQVRSAGLGKLVGRPTGGNQRGINGGRFFFLRLPHSRIEVDLPLVAYFPPRPLPDAGLRPDVLVGHTVEGVAAGSDPELDSVRRMLWSKR